MKIICNKREFALLVRECALTKNEDTCRGCLFASICAQGGDSLYDEIMEAIEDICEVEAGG